MTKILLYALALGLLLLVRTASTCDLVDVATAEKVLGSEVIDTTVDPATFCNFISKTTSASLSVRSDTAEMYDQVTIPPPHASVDIGDKGRSHEFERGGATVQFVKDSKSFTLGVTTPGSNKDMDYLPALLEAAKALADRLD